MKQIITLLTILLFSNTALACMSDYDCGYGNKCIKPAGSISLSGTCITPTDQFGNRDFNSSYDNWGSGYGPTNVNGCSFDIDCPIGFKCLKQVGALEGICSR